MLAHEGVHARRGDNVWHYGMALAGGQGHFPGKPGGGGRGYLRRGRGDGVGVGGTAVRGEIEGRLGWRRGAGPAPPPPPGEGAGEKVQRMETESLIARLFDDSKAQFLSAFLGGEGLAPAEAAQLRALIDSLEEVYKQGAG